MAAREIIPHGALASAAGPRVRMKAKEFGVFTARDGSIIYFDPKHDDEEHRYPVVSEVDVAALETRGLAERATGSLAKNIEEAAPADISNIGERSAQELAKVAQIDHKAGQPSSALDTISTVAWAEPEKVRGGIQGMADGSGTGIVDGDPDAPPAPATQTAQTAPIKQSQPRAKPGPKAKAAAPKPPTSPAATTPAPAPAPAATGDGADKA